MPRGVVRTHRTRRDWPMTPESCRANNWRVEVRCEKCGPPKVLELDPAGRLKRFWTMDWEAIYKQARFRCKTCHRDANGLRVSRQTRDHTEVLFLLTHDNYHG